MWSTILLKGSHLIKIAESETFFKQKLITDSTILNKWKSFSGMMDKRRGLPWGPYNFSQQRDTIVAFLLSPVMVQPVSWGGKTMTCGGKSVEMLQTCSVATMAAVKGKFIMNFFFFK